MISSFFKNKNGFILPLSAIALMVLFLIGGIVIDLGNLYIRYGELQHLAKQSANTGIITFSQILQKQADANKNNLCYETEIISEICFSNNVFDFLTNSEILTSLTSFDVQKQIINSSENFITTYDPQKLITNDDLEIIFPDNFTKIEKIKIRVKIKFIAKQFFSEILKSNEITVEAVSFLETEK